MKRRARLLVIGLVGVVLSHGTTARAAMTGAEFLQAPPPYQSAFVNGFVRGLYSACLDHLEAKKEVCSFAPVLDAALEMTPEQVLEDFLNYVRKNAALQQKEASELLVDCLKETARPADKAAEPAGAGRPDARRPTPEGGLSADGSGGS